MKNFKIGETVWYCNDYGGAVKAKITKITEKFCLEVEGYEVAPTSGEYLFYSKQEAKEDYKKRRSARLKKILEEIKNADKHN